MATIGAFTKSKTGAFTGSIKTLALDIKLEIRPVETDSDKAPDYRIYAGETEVGAAWKRKSREERDYVSVKLDDPSFSAPVYANLFEGDDGHSLIWSR
ncbi:MAG: DUF736 domain-containing protein [Caulobacterales bacterium]|nr:DUF736 domain-containing protein [Caulobacterales bacterium]